MLVLYLGLVVGLVVGEVGVGGLAVVYQGRVVSGLVAVMSGRLTAHYGHPTQLPFTNALDYVQYQLQCCGVHNHTDWKSSRWYREGLGGFHRAESRRVVPLTCCTLQHSPLAHLNPLPVNETLCQSPLPELHTGVRHTVGCMERVRAWVRGESALLVAAGVGLGALQLAALVAGVALCRGARAPHGSCSGAP
ncbi:CD151 antigen-like [Hyalella azteca]|uniref:CD151 antigen-like n=1 Tax=Hyalella azteca TaxID=294128 RepID=A0A979FJN8_HYAAZ|nr:CD151 antigen-like [Hyalella azteca]